jgi:hypothetical protein
MSNLRQIALGVSAYSCGGHALALVEPVLGL